MILNGKGTVTGFQGKLSDQDVADVNAYANRGGLDGHGAGRIGRVCRSEASRRVKSAVPPCASASVRCMTAFGAGWCSQRP